MTTAIERLQTALDTLRLKAVEARLESLLEQASKKEPSYADFLEELLSCEVEARRSRYLRARLQLAHLPFVKTFERSEEHTSELQSRLHLVCRLLLEKKKYKKVNVLRRQPPA